MFFCLSRIHRVITTFTGRTTVYRVVRFGLVRIYYIILEVKLEVNLVSFPRPKREEFYRFTTTVFRVHDTKEENNFDWPNVMTRVLYSDGDHLYCVDVPAGAFEGREFFFYGLKPLVFSRDDYCPFAGTRRSRRRHRRRRGI